MATLKLKEGIELGSGARAIKIEKVSKDLIYVRGGQDGKPLRFIPVAIIEALLNAINKNQITVWDISRKNWSEHHDSHLFDELGLSFDKYILGYDSTLQKICEYLLENADEHPENKPALTSVSLSKPFLLLAGISGTGKTRFVREQAKTSGSLAETYCLTSVRPDWHEPSDLLGYVSRLEGEARFVTTDVLIFIAKAWRALIDAGLTLNAENSEPSDSYPLVSGAEEMLNSIPPYWLCLDEMNLAPVEQYFADYLSVLETREWLWEDDTFYYRCDALLKPSTISSVANKEQLRTDLGFDSPAYDALWEFICDYGMSLPFNLIVAGTVNMDETTHGFSRKVIDRALSFDFGEFFPNRYDEFFAPTIVNSTLSYPRLAQATRDQLQLTKDTDGSKTLAFLTNINRVLERTPFELAYRALNELFLAVICSQPKDDLALKAVWDDFLMCKVLPRIEGDIDKLKTKEGKCLLTTLEAALSQELAPIWDAEQGKLRPDLYRERQASGEQEQMLEAVHIPCRTRQKLAWMKQRLDDSTFTSFWP